MAEPQHDRRRLPKRGVLARPLDALVFLLPLIVFYEVASRARPDRVIAFDLLRRFLELFGPVGVWAPALGVVVILLATHAASGERWTIRWSNVFLMYPESALWAVPLLSMNWVVGLTAANGANRTLVDQFALGVGAGVYEELVFRLILISLIMMIGVDVLKLGRATVAVVAVLLSALAFAAHHHPPIGIEPFQINRFLFRAGAGVYLAIVFWFRGYGLAAGCHAAYNVGLAVDGLLAP